MKVSTPGGIEYEIPEEPNTFGATLQASDTSERDALVQVVVGLQRQIEVAEGRATQWEGHYEFALATMQGQKRRIDAAEALIDRLARVQDTVGTPEDVA